MAKKVRTVASAVALFLALAATTSAQVVAKTGAASIQRFDSPMVLEMPFAGANPAVWIGSAIFVNEPLGTYLCDNVSISNVTLNVSKPRKGFIRTVISGVLKNAPGHDKLVSVSFHVFDGETLIGDGATIHDTDVEEGGMAVRQAVLKLPEAKLREHPDAKLRITVTVRDH